MSTLAEAAVQALNELYGRHPGCRAAHAKGIACKGKFAAEAEAARLTTAEHMQGGLVDVTVRFSNGSGDPQCSDRKRDVRGMATTFHLPGGERTDIVAVTLPCFVARTPEDFLALTRARGARPLARPWKLLAFLVRHRESWRALRAVVGTKPPASYAGCRYNALHAYRWVAADGRKRHVRYRWVPEQHIDGKTDDLRGELADRLARGSVRFALQLEIAGAGERVDDPTAVWRPRRTLIAGTLELTELDPAGDALVFDPTRVTAGIELSDDPILRFRPLAYDVSARRRSEMPAAEAAPR